MASDKLQYVLTAGEQKQARRVILTSVVSGTLLNRTGCLSFSRLQAKCGHILGIHLFLQLESTACE